MKTIQVVAALIFHEGKLFATQRGYGAWRDYWEFPGGKIEPGETPQEALAREIREELDTGVDVLDHVCDVEYDYPEFHLSMQCFRCEITSGEPKLLEHEAAKWLARTELNTVNWLPADWSILPEIEKNWPAVQP
ncbi:MAG: (deoxy)nucleoside triphosphate pyrophosphohydrolase [Clostridia bacterium]|nr:(deoxy)nucleoside triphosphate pyrophosphohydrolase [Clostridia bacterium]